MCLCDQDPVAVTACGMFQFRQQGKRFLRRAGVDHDAQQFTGTALKNPGADIRLIPQFAGCTLNFFPGSDGGSGVAFIAQNRRYQLKRYLCFRRDIPNRDFHC